MSRQLMSLAEVATELGIHESSIRKGLLGTAGLTRIRPGGGKRILFVRAEVQQLIEQWIAAARDQRDRGREFLKMRKDRAWLKGGP